MCPRIHDLPNERKQKDHDGAGGLNDYVEEVDCRDSTKRKIKGLKGYPLKPLELRLYVFLCPGTENR